MNSDFPFVVAHLILHYGLMVRAVMTNEKLYILSQGAKQISLVIGVQAAGCQLSRLSPRNHESKIVHPLVVPSLERDSPAKKHSVITNIDNSFLTPINANELLNGAQSVCDSKGRQ